MRKRAMVVGLILVPLVTGGAVLFAKSRGSSAAHDDYSAPHVSGTVSPEAPAPEVMPAIDRELMESSSAELSPGEPSAVSKDPNKDKSEQPQQDKSKDQAPANQLGSDDVTAGPLLADASHAPAPRSLLNRHAFAGGRQPSGMSAISGSAGQSAQVDSAVVAQDSKNSQSGSESSTTADDASDTNSTSGGEHPSDAGPNANGQGSDEQVVDQPPAEEKVPSPGNDGPSFHLPPADEELPHVTVPEPSTLMLLGMALLACAGASRRRRVKL